MLAAYLDAVQRGAAQPLPAAPLEAAAHLGLHAGNLRQALDLINRLLPQGSRPLTRAELELATPQALTARVGGRVQAPVLAMRALLRGSSAGAGEAAAAPVAGTANGLESTPVAPRPAPSPEAPPPRQGLAAQGTTRSRLDSRPPAVPAALVAPSSPNTVAATASDPAELSSAALWPQLLCPQTGRPLVEPVFDRRDGRTHERATLSGDALRDSVRDVQVAQLLEDWRGHVDDPDARIEACYETLCCPITQQLMRDPVVAPDNHVYERSAILRWLAVHDHSPITRQFMAPHLVTHQTLTELVAREELQQCSAMHEFSVDPPNADPHTDALPRTNVPPEFFTPTRLDPGPHSDIPSFMVAQGNHTKLKKMARDADRLMTITGDPISLAIRLVNTRDRLQKNAEYFLASRLASPEERLFVRKLQIEDARADREWQKLLDQVRRFPAHGGTDDYFLLSRHALALLALGDTQQARPLIAAMLQNPQWRSSNVGQEVVGKILLLSGFPRSALYYLERASKGRSYVTQPNTFRALRQTTGTGLNRKKPPDAAVEADLTSLQNLLSVAE